MMVTTNQKRVAIRRALSAKDVNSRRLVNTAVLISVLLSGRLNQTHVPTINGAQPPATSVAERLGPSRGTINRAELRQPGRIRCCKGTNGLQLTVTHKATRSRRPMQSLLQEGCQELRPENQT